MPHRFSVRRLGTFCITCCCALATLLLVGTATDRAAFLATSSCAAAEASAAAKKKAAEDKSKKRAASLAAVAAQLEIGPGSAIADIGAGGGQDTWVFAGIVGPSGTVFAQEVTDGKVKKLQEVAEQKKLGQVRAVLGRHDDPCLPEASADMAYMRYVYHHFAKPREMLRGLWRGLKPGGYLVIVDKHKGTLRDWVDRDLRSKKHFFIAETTVVREAREEGFAVFGFGEKDWYADDEFVLIFQRPDHLSQPQSDPDLPLPLAVDSAAAALLPLKGSYERPAVIALGPSRDLIGPILQRSTGSALEIVLEEWATRKDERPPLPKDVSFPSVLTEKGNPPLDEKTFDAVFFLDSYHLLFHGPALLKEIHQRLEPFGCIYVLDRKAKRTLSRREASHFRQIASSTVEQEMAAAGFELWFRGPQPAADRFLLVFGKTKAADVPPDQDPFVGGPAFPLTPGEWLAENDWRLRGLRTTHGQLVRFSGKQLQPQIVQQNAGQSAGVQRWSIPSRRLVLSFQKKNNVFELSGCVTVEP